MGTFLALRQARFWHAERWPNQGSDSGVCRMGIRSQAFEQKRPFAACSVIRVCGSCASIGAQKNGLRLLRAGPERLVRPARAAGSGPVERRISDCSGTRSAARRVPPLRHSEARTAGFSGGQSPLHQTLCVLCRPPLPAGIDPRCRQGAQARLGHGQDAGEAVHGGQLMRAGTPGPRAIGIDEISVRKGHSYRIVVSDLVRKRPIWFGGEDRSEASMAAFYDWLGLKKSRKIKLAVMDMWKPFRNVTQDKAPQAAILFDKFHIMRHLGEALDKVRKAEYARLSGRDRRFIKGQKYNLLSRHENLTLEGKRALKILLAANRRLNTAYLLKEVLDR